MDINAIAGPLGAILAVLAAALTWKLTETKREKDTKDAQKVPGMLQVAAFTADHAPRLIADAITDVGKCICEALKEAHECEREFQRNDRVFRADIKEILDEMNRHLGVVAKATRAREDREN